MSLSLFPAIQFERLNNIIGWGFSDIQNNQGQGKGYQPKPKAEAFIILDYHKNRI